MAGLLSRFSKSAKHNGPIDPPADDAFVPIGHAELARRVELLDSLESSGAGWFWATDAQGRLTYLSPAALSELGIEQDQAIGQPIIDIFQEDREANREGAGRPLRFQFSASNTIPPTTVQVAHCDRTVWLEIAAKPHFDADSQFTGFRGTAKDVTATYDQRRDAERLSQFDSLTGLANRHRMASQLTAALTTFKQAKRSCALMLLDLDRFKQVNDTLGHPAGDELLKQVSERITQIVGGKGEIGRIGGDEFQIILHDHDDRGLLGELATRLIQSVSQPYSINGSRAVIGTSVGIAIAPYDGVESDELIKAADLALYAAKGGGRGQHRFYSSDLRESASHRHQLEADLRDALVKDELQMHFQPIVDAKTHTVASMEALMRWNHSERGMISPADFIPVAEEVGLIRELGTWALNEVCQLVTGWPEGVKAAVNVSAVQFAADDFLDVVKNALKKSGVNPSQIELEITESVFVGDLERSLALFKALKKLGVSLSLDDFGTGYSSLSYLRDAPFDKVKIDQSFVRGCAAEDNNNASIVSAVVGLAKALKMTTVAEGVETKDEMNLVSELGATYLQGVLFSRALSPEDVSSRFEAGEFKFAPIGHDKFRADRRTEFRRISLIHGDHRYNVLLRNLSKTGAKIEGLLGVGKGTEVVLDLGGGQLAVATVSRAEASSQGLKFETPLISDGADGLVTRHRVSPYAIEAAGKPLAALGDDPYAELRNGTARAAKAFMEVEIS